MSKLIAIINITPDSFSDGGTFDSLAKIRQHIDDVITSGADILDIGAESTRPGAIPLSADEEWQRLEALLPAIITQAHQHHVKVSLDTRHGTTANNALNAGVDWINDVSGLTDPIMINVLKTSECNIVMMHNLGIPANKNLTIPISDNPVEVVYQWALHQLEQLEECGIKRERIILDPGIGFGKTAEQSLTLLQHIDRFHALNVPLLVGHSRKSFLQDFTSNTPSDRDIETVTTSLYLSEKKVDYLRVHNIAAHHNAFHLQHALRG